MPSRRNPFEELERLFERLGGQFEGDWGRGVDLGEFGEFGVAVDVADHGDEFVVTADLPGYEKSDIDVTLRGDTLRIAAEREVEEEEEVEGEYLRRERRAASASRSVTLPEEVDESGVSASYANGVLTVTLPKADLGGESHEIDVE